MISVDDRVGSAEMIPRLRRLGCEVESTRLDYGDLAWMGIGIGGIPVNVGLEIKRLGDILACVISGRYAGHQLPGMLKCFDHIYLLIQGQWRARPRDGILEEGRTGHGGGMYWAEAGGGQRVWMWRDLESWLMTMSVLGGVRIHRVADWDEGAAWIKCLYNWYQRDSHSSHLVMHHTKELFPADQALLVRPTLARRVAADLPGIGLVRSAAVASRFHTVEDMVSASVGEWASIDGVGKVTAEKVYRAIHGMNGKGGGR